MLPELISRINELHLHFSKLFQLPMYPQSPRQPNNKYNSQPSLYLFNHRETGTLSIPRGTTYSFTRSVPTALIPCHDGASVDSQVQSKE